MSLQSDSLAASLTTDELHELNGWLSNLKDRATSLFEVHGFLCAILTSPTTIPSDKWFAAMLGSKLAKRVPANELQIRLHQLMRLNHQLTNSLMHDEIVYPLIDYQPVLPFEAYNLSDSQRDNLRLWCQGYLAAVRLAPEGWTTLQDNKHLLYTLRALKQKELTAKSLGALPETNLSEGQLYKFESDLIEALPVLIAAVYDAACSLTESTKLTNKSEKTTMRILSKEERAKRAIYCSCESGKLFTQCCAIVH